MPTKTATFPCSRNVPGSIFRWFTTTTVVPFSHSKRVRRANACSPRYLRPGANRVSMYPELALYIGGEWKNGDRRKGEDVLNPATGKPLGHLPHAAPADLDLALAAAEKG